jgi:hypothetical protein
MQPTSEGLSGETDSTAMVSVTGSQGNSVTFAADLRAAYAARQPGIQPTTSPQS